MEHLKCPRIESSEYLCDREASYCVDGVVYCERHARRIMEKTRQPYMKKADLKRMEGASNGNN